MKYDKGKGYYVGQFNEQDLANKVDKKRVADVMEKTGLRYTNTQLVKSKGEYVGIKIWVCSLGDAF